MSSLHGGLVDCRHLPCSTGQFERVALADVDLSSAGIIGDIELCNAAALLVNVTVAANKCTVRPLRYSLVDIDRLWPIACHYPSLTTAQRFIAGKPFYSCESCDTWPSPHH
jgi:hypothetical protein